jgi:hypothetical protein
MTEFSELLLDRTTGRDLYGHVLSTNMQRRACVCEKRKILCGAFVWDLLRSCGAVERLDHPAHVECGEKIILWCLEHANFFQRGL